MRENLKYAKLYKDNYNICNLIKKINRAYRLLFDEYNKLFIIINSANNNEICLKFKSISPEIIKILQKSKIENAKKIFDEIDSFNENLTQKNIKALKEKTIDSAYELTKFASRTNNITNESINKIIGGKYA